jgi:branched-chain amino acid transport system substrate-binding protein
MKKTRRAVIGLVIAITIVGCSDSPNKPGSESVSSNGLPKIVKIMSLKDITEPDITGPATKKGSDLALEQIASQKFLGDTQLQVDTKDSEVKTQLAASFANQAVADKSYSAILGPAGSAESAAISAIVQPAHMPTIYTQSGSAGVVTGDYTFRVTAPVSSYFEIAGQYLKSKGITTTAVMYANNNPTETELGTKTIPGMASQYGFSISSTDSVPGDAVDFTPFATKMASSKPGAVFLMLFGHQSAVAITQLRRAGYTGQVVGMSAMGSGNLKNAGELAKGAVWPTDFQADQTGASSQAFVKAYEAKYNETPSNYAAEGYDATWFLARGIKDANSADRTAIQQGLATVAKQGFDGAMGKLTFEGTDLRIQGALAMWTGSGETAIPVGGQ